VSTRIEVQVTEDNALVTVRGVIDGTTPGGAAGLAELRESCRVVVDLREAVLASRRGVEALVAAVRQQVRPDTIALVCDRLPGRRLLRLACRASGVRILDEMPPVSVAERRQQPRTPHVAKAV
jgi:hypothetical protein